MSTNFANLVWTATGGTAGRTNAARNADLINIKDWGAVGDGTHDDRPHIQAAIDYISAGLTSGEFKFCIAGLYFPPGNYRINSSTTTNAENGALVVNFGETNGLANFIIQGDNSATTRIFYDGPLQDPGNTVLFQFDQRVTGAFVRGLHFDMTPATGGNLPLPTTAASLCFWNQGRQGRAGSNNTWFDCKFTGASYGLAHSFPGVTQGAECVHIFCKYDDCWQGWTTFSSNALDHVHIGGYAKNCTSCGVIARQGAWVSLFGMQFEGNAPLDVPENKVGDVSSQNNNPFFLCGCNSTSQDFVAYQIGVSYVVGNYHHSSTTGIFWRSQNNAIFDSNWSTNSAITNATHGGDGPDGQAVVCLRGNRFDYANYISSFIPAHDCTKVGFDKQVFEPCPWDPNY